MSGRDVALTPETADALAHLTEAVAAHDTAAGAGVVDEATRNRVIRAAQWVAARASEIRQEVRAAPAHQEACDPLGTRLEAAEADGWWCNLDLPYEERGKEARGRVADFEALDTVWDAEGRVVASVFIDNQNDAERCANRARFIAHAPEDLRALRAELAEAKAEILAYRGDMGGALPWWGYMPGVHARWQRSLDSGWRIVVHLDRSWSLRPFTVEAMDQPSAGELWFDCDAPEPSLRDAMRAGDAKARSQGLL